MPLITITCHPDWYPEDDSVKGGRWQTETVLLARNLPPLFSDNAAKLGLEPCPPEAVQVNFERFHPGALNVPRLWIKVELTERPSELSFKDKLEELLTGRPIPRQELQLKEKLKQLLEPLLRANDIPSIAVDIFWGPGHGWLNFGSTKLDW